MPKHHVVPRPHEHAFDVHHELVQSLFERYSDPSGGGGERLVDVEAFYGRLKRAVLPPSAPSRDEAAARQGLLLLG